MSVQSPLGASFGDLRKKRIIEILAAFIAGGWLLLEFVHWILVDHYHFPEKTIDITFVTVLGVLISTLLWRWFSGREKPRKFKLELVLIPLVLLVTILLDVNLLLHLKGPQPEPVMPSKWRNSVAVLPFEDLSPQKDQDWFCDGITVDIINRLSNIRELKVPARTSVFYFKGKDQDIRDIGKKLGVATVLEGSIQKAGPRLRIQVNLVNIADGTNIWPQTFDRDLKDVLAIQDEIALAVADKLKLTLLGEEKARVVKRYTNRDDAYDSYMRGTWLLYNKVTAEDWRKAILYFERATEIDPNFSLAFAAMADADLYLSTYHFVSAYEALPRAKKALQQALSIDHELPEALVLWGTIKFRFEYDWAGGESDIKKVLELNPNNVYAHINLGNILLNKGETDRAVEEFSAALELDPISLIGRTNFAWFMYQAGKYDAAIGQCKKALDLDPEYPYALATLGSCYIQKSMLQEAIAAFQKALASSGKNTEYMSYLAYAYVFSGNREGALEILKEIDALSERTYVTKYYLASVQAALGNKDKAFDDLEAAYKERDGDLLFLKTDPRFDVLRSDPRYELILKKIGLGK